MFLKCHSRVKDGKEHRYWNIVENRRCGRGKFVQRQVLYLGEINDTQRESWCRTIEVFDENRERTMALALFAADRQLPNFAAEFGVQVRLKEMELHRPRQWGACWLGCHLYEQLELDEFWAERLADSREGTGWQRILQTVVCYRLLDPGSEWRLQRSDCVQVVIGLIITPEGFPLAYEVLPGNTSDKTTLRDFLRKIAEQYGKAERVWLMDRGIPTEEVLAEMRSSDPPISYLVGTPKGRLSKLEDDLLERPWQSVRPGVEVKVLPQENELYLFAQSRDRLNK